jgi:hypothetical protein
MRGKRLPGRAWNFPNNFALCVRTEEALRSVLRALPIFQDLNHLPDTSPPAKLHRNVTIVVTKLGLAFISIGECDSVRWLA